MSPTESCPCPRTVDAEAVPFTLNSILLKMLQRNRKNMPALTADSMHFSQLGYEVLATPPSVLAEFGRHIAIEPPIDLSDSASVDGAGNATLTFDGVAGTAANNRFKGNRVLGLYYEVEVPRDTPSPLFTATITWYGEGGVETDLTQTFKGRVLTGGSGGGTGRVLVLPGTSFRGSRRYTPAYLSGDDDLTPLRPAQQIVVAISNAAPGMQLSAVPIVAGHEELNDIPCCHGG